MNLKERTSKYGLQNYVHFLGYQTNPYKFLSRTKLLVSMSYQEGFSGAFVEAISLGKPFVSTDVGGAKELSCNGKFGKIITSDEEAVEAIISYISGREYPDADEMAEFIEDLQLNPRLIRSKGSCVVVRRGIKWKSILKILILKEFIF